MNHTTELAIDLPYAGPGDWGTAEIADAFMGVWSELAKERSRQNIRVTDDAEFSVQADWSEHREWLQEIRDADVEWTASGNTPPEHLWERRTAPVRLAVSVPTALNLRPEHLAESYLYCTFLGMNLAAPGSMKFGGVARDTGITLKPLDSYPLVSAWSSCVARGWPEIRVQPLSHVVAWLRTVGIASVQVARTSLHRALFSLLNLCETENCPSQVLWASMLLESLYKTPRVDIAERLKSRTLMVLPTGKSKDARKLLSRFYDFRSRLAHGDFNVESPQQNDILDPESATYVAQFDEPLATALGVALATLQFLVAEGRTELDFEERLV